MRNVFLMGLFIVILISSCKKDNEAIDKPPTETADYTPMAIGNYWVYENSSVDTNGIEKIIAPTDSIIITGDTLIGGNTYFVFEGTYYPKIRNWGIINILRDSADYLVDKDGKILFSSSNFSDILHETIEINNSDTLYTLQYQMEAVNNSVVVKDSIFKDVFDFKGSLHTNNPLNGMTNPRYMSNYYAPNVGKIFKTNYFLGSPTVYQKRLLNYNIQ